MTTPTPRLNVEGLPGGLGERPCLVCEKPCATEGQLCPACAAAGHRVTDTEVIVLLTDDYPEAPR